MALWDSLLMQGRHLTGRGGSDVHHQETFEAGLLNVGNPTTWIYAEAATAEPLLEGLTRGHVSISYAPGAERLSLEADGDGDGECEAMMGDTVAGGEGGELRVQIEGFRAGAPYQLIVVRDGVAGLAIALGASELTLHFDARPERYVRAQLHGEVPLAIPQTEQDGLFLYGDAVALSNPLYFE